LLNCIYKFFTKVFTNILQSIFSKIIGPTQNALLKGRFILEGVVTAHEILHVIHLSKEQGVLLKINFQKEFDFVNWSNLLSCFR
jgi:hypothetical protein